MRLFRISNILSFAAAILCGVLLFWTSQAVQHKEGQLAEIRHKLTQETDTLRVLTVEWDYLNNPPRLEQLAREQLGMEPPSAREVVREVRDIPEPLYEEAIIQHVSAKPEKRATPKPETISPSKAERQNFDSLINSLNGGAR